MADLAQSLPYLRTNEGGYGEPPETDQPTNCGIIAADLAQYLNISVKDVTVQMLKNLSPTGIADIYRKLYWDELCLGSVADQNIATCIFDTAVNRGLSVGAKYAQRTCNLLGCALVVDGVIGAHTIAAINSCERAKFINIFENLEAAGYLAILAAHPEDAKYKNDWMGRAKRLLTLAQA